MEQGPKHQWNPSFRNPIAHTNVDLVVAELEIIHEVYGEISPQLIVDSAKNTKSVLHSYFNWDNENAANKYRLTQARELLKRIEITTISDGQPKTVRIYETVSRPNPISENAEEYKRFDLLTDKDNIRLIKTAIADMMSIKTRLERMDQKEALKHILQAILCLQVSVSEKEESGRPSMAVV